MLPKRQRFSFKGTLPRNVYHSQSFTVRYQKNDEGLKVAVVVSKKVDNRATVRNKIKRRLIDIVQKNLKTNTPFDKAQGRPFNLVFYVKKQVLGSDSLENELSNAISKFKT